MEIWKLYAYNVCFDTLNSANYHPIEILININYPVIELLMI